MKMFKLPEEKEGSRRGLSYLYSRTNYATTFGSSRWSCLAILAAPLAIFLFVFVASTKYATVSTNSNSIPLNSGIKTLHCEPSLLPSKGNLLADDSRPRAVVHIGPHKTASTHIQVESCHHREALLQGGWFWPTCTQCSKCTASHGLAFHLMNDSIGLQQYGCTDDEIGCFKKALDGRPPNTSIFISSEEFSHFGNLEQIEALSDLISDFRVTIVFFYRQKLDLLSSIFTEVNEHSPEPDTMRNYIFKVSGSRPDMDVPQILSRFAQVFSRESIYVISYDGVAHQGLSPFEVMVKDVLSLGDSFQIKPAHEGVNVGTGPLSVEMNGVFLRWIKKKHENANVDPFCTIQHAVQFINEHQLPVYCSTLHRLFANWVATDLDFIQCNNLKYSYFDFDALLEGAQQGSVCAIDEIKLQKEWDVWSPLIANESQWMIENCSKS